MPKVSNPEVRVNVPGIVIASPKVTPPAPFMVQFELPPVNNEAGRVIALAFVKATVPVEAFINPFVRTGELPANVMVFEPVVKVPVVKVSVPLIV